MFTADDEFQEYMQKQGQMQAFLKEYHELKEQLKKIKQTPQPYETNTPSLLKIQEALLHLERNAKGWIAILKKEKAFPEDIEENQGLLFDVQKLQDKTETLISKENMAKQEVETLISKENSAKLRAETLILNENFSKLQNSLQDLKDELNSIEEVQQHHETNFIDVIPSLLQTKEDLPRLEEDLMKLYDDCYSKKIYGVANDAKELAIEIHLKLKGTVSKLIENQEKIAEQHREEKQNPESKEKETLLSSPTKCRYSQFAEIQQRSDQDSDTKEGKEKELHISQTKGI